MNENKIFTPAVIVITILFSPIWLPVAILTLAVKVSAIAATTVWNSK